VEDVALKVKIWSYAKVIFVIPYDYGGSYTYIYNLKDPKMCAAMKKYGGIWIGKGKWVYANKYKRGYKKEGYSHYSDEFTCARLPSIKKSDIEAIIDAFVLLDVKPHER
jgi:hypothetical protein